MTGRDDLPVAFTFDLHDVDEPEDIRIAAEAFAARGISATFFVPSAMLAEPRYSAPLRRLAALGHEAGSHGHDHDWNEIDALMAGDERRVGFLAVSSDRHAQFFGALPTSFRSPRWCTLGRAAVNALHSLGYVADSSATPQRLPLFSSKPFHPGWWNSPRGLHALAPGLVEVPTSTLLVPAGAPAFLTFRSFGSSLFLAMLEAEARFDPGRPVVLQFHVEDFHAASVRQRTWGSPRWTDLTLRPRGGFRLKVFLRETVPGRIVATHESIVARREPSASSTVTALARSWLKGDSARPNGAARMSEAAPA